MSAAPEAPAPPARADGGISADAGDLALLTRTLLERNRQLEHALESRIVIEQAKGVLAERFELTTDGAFEVLRRASRSNRVRLRDLAARVLASRETPVEIGLDGALAISRRSDGAAA